MDATQLDGFIHGKRTRFEESESSTKEYAAHMDATDPLARFRNEFLIPSKADLKDPHPEEKPADQQNGTDPNHYYQVELILNTSQILQTRVFT